MPKLIRLASLSLAALALTHPSGKAATEQELAQVTLKLQRAAAPWCERLAEREADGRKRCTVSVDVAKADGLVNAMAGMGRVWITADMLSSLSEPDLALVLGHEFAHLVLGHALQRLRNADSTDAARRALLAFAESTYVPPHDDAPTDLTRQELDADELGLYFAGLAGYPVRSLATFGAERAPSLPASTLRSVATHNVHPTHAARAAALSRVAAQFCERLAAGQPLMPAAVHQQPRYDADIEALRHQQAGLRVASVCRQPDSP